jgi:hypothetical protein
MSKLNNSYFNEIDTNELYKIEGGSAILVICTLLGGYAVIREIVRDAGRTAAYRDLALEGT